MGKYKRITVVLLMIFILFITILIISYYLITRSFPETSGTISLKGLSKKVKVYRDQYGVPHIIAQTDYDAFFAVGFVQAQDRLWQMDLTRRVGMGRLSEILGDKTLSIDKMFRTLGIYRYAEMASARIDTNTIKALQAYADGVNEFIKTHKGKYPVEFDMLNFEPEPWKVEHSIMVSRLMSWELNYARWVDMLLAELVQRFGEETAKEIFPNWPDDAPTIIPKELKGRNFAEGLRPLFEIETKYHTLFGFSPIGSGSNAWVVSGKKSVTGKPILANDPHLTLMVPGRWYELHIMSPGLNVAGMSIPGVPFVVLGRNQNIAWGVTNAMLDDADFYLEEVDSLLHPTCYKYNGKWLPITEFEDTILVKGSLPVVITIYKTHRGPIINRIEPTAQNIPWLVSLKWVGLELSDEPTAFYKINKASNWKEFENALKYFSTPAQNFVYADNEGNIGYRMAGKLPIRASKGPTLPFPGWTDQFEWQGYVPFEKLPNIKNPDQGFISTANNKIVDDSYPYHVSHHWESPWRSIRINEVLSEQDKFGMEDMQRLQLDLISLQAREVVPYIIHAYDSISINDENVNTMIKYFKNWNYEMREEDVSTTLFQTIIVKLIYNIFHDKMGDRLYGLYDTLACLPLTALSNLLKNPESYWFDNPKTYVRETRDDMIRKSVTDALQYLKNELGGELKEWQWGKLHKITFRHIFGNNKLLAPVFNLGPYSVGGSHATINVGHFFIAHSFECTVGPSMRQIFNLANINDTRTVMPPGQSGQPFSKHYNDQIIMWLNGGYKLRTMDESAIESSCDELLILEPEK